jgi:hypothetical protein
MLLVLGALVTLIAVAILSTVRVLIHSSTDLGVMSEQWLAEHRASSHLS